VSRATVVYLTMILVFVAGLWAVMTAGARLTAPEDLSGRWVAIDAPGANTWPAVTVEQSGRFFQMAFDDGPADVAVSAQDTSAEGRLSLARGAWHVTIDGSAGQAVRTFHVDGPISGTFTGRRPGPTTAPAGKGVK
jgi:hypothetical protein